VTGQTVEVTFVDQGYTGDEAQNQLAARRPLTFSPSVESGADPN